MERYWETGELDEASNVMFGEAARAYVLGQESGFAQQGRAEKRY
ncbi:MAG: hypothetical protein R2912_08740 [Eubacteriales bacterium]